MKKKIIYSILATLVLIQFFQIDKNPPPVEQEKALEAVANPPAAVLASLKKRCYDCHSNETTYPWYASIQPVGWWLRSHVRGGRMNLNFSEIGLLSPEERKDILREAAEEIEKEKMPMKSYANMHSEAAWSEAEQAAVLEWLRNPVPADMSVK